MPRHYDAVIGTAIESDETRAPKLADLREKLHLELHRTFEQDVGYPVPSIHHAEILVADAALKYAREVGIEEFQGGVYKLVRSKFTEDDEIFDAALRVGSKLVHATILEHIPAMSADGSIQSCGYHEVSPIDANGEQSRVFIVAACVSVSLCSKLEWYTEQDFLLSEFVFSIFRSPLHRITGGYECHVYDNSVNKNDWHYVSISRISDTRFEWVNRAGVRWTLTATPERTKLAVGPECPYFNAGYNTATVVWAGDGVLGIHGPNNQLYEKTP